MLNLPQTITKNNGSTVVYVYSAGGNKLRKLFTAGGTTTTTEYDNGIQYDNSTTNVAFIQTEEGRARHSGTTYTYEYDLKDHLGNTRVTLTPDPNDLTQQTARILQENDYYVFGYGIQSMQQSVPSPKNEYLYNHKELQEETGLYDYGARFYDPVIGRWTSVDPLAEKGRRWSPYNYGFNDPIRFTDPDGMWPDGPPGWDAARLITAVKNWWNSSNSTAGSITDGYQVQMGQGGYSGKDRTNGTAVIWAIASGLQGYNTGNAMSRVFSSEGQPTATPEVSTPTVGARANEIHAVVKPRTQTSTTIAVADATDASGNNVRIVGSSEPQLRRDQRAMLQSNEVEAKGVGHAEVTVINHAKDNGLTIQSIGASRPVCGNCAIAINAIGLQPSTPVSTRPFKPIVLIK